MSTDSCCSKADDKYSAQCVFTAGSVGPDSAQFVVPEGGWAELHADAIPDGENICVYEVFCFCGKPDKHVQLVINCKPSGMRPGCLSAIIPKGGTYYLQYSGADIDFDVVVKNHASVSDLETVMNCGVCA